MSDLRFTIATALAIPLIVLLLIYSGGAIVRLCFHEVPTSNSMIASILTGFTAVFLIYAYYFLPSPYGIIYMAVFTGLCCYAIAKKGKPRFQKYALWLYVAVAAPFWWYIGWWYFTGQTYDSI